MTVQTKITKNEMIKSVSDDYGNLIISKNNGKRIVVKLKLISEKTYRTIGTINKSTKAIRIVRKKSMHLLNKANAYGFNYNFLSSAKQFNIVNLEDEYSRWKIPVEFILTNGEFLFFKEQGFEKQIFITLQKIEQFKKEKIWD